MENRNKRTYESFWVVLGIIISIIWCIISSIVNYEESSSDNYSTHNNDISKQAQVWYDNGMAFYQENNFREASYWFAKSADAGNADAQNMLDKIRIQVKEWYDKGMMNYRERQFQQAAYWLVKSADAGNVDAQHMLDYENGRKPDSSHISFEEALQWKANYERGGY